MKCRTWGRIGLVLAAAACSPGDARLGAGAGTGAGSGASGGTGSNSGTGSGSPGGVASGTGGGGSSQPAETACNPLATHPTTLATILGGGKDQGGTLYVADQGGIAMAPSIVRVFLTEAGSLVRQDVIGSGSIRSSEDIETFESPDGLTSPRDLTIQLAGGTASSMTLGPGGSAKSGLKGMDAGAAMALTLVDPSTVQGMPAIDLPGAVIYVANAPDGEAIVVTAPLEDDLGSAAFHLFYGTPDAMVERPIVSFEQSLSGYPRIGFTVGSETYVMAISSVPFDGGLGEAPGPVTLVTGDGGSVTFTLRMPTPTNLSGFTFTCLGTSGTTSGTGGGLCDAAAALPPPTQSAQCAGSQLAAASPVTITTPDPDPSNPTLAASPSGDRFLAMWTDGGWSINGVAVPQTVWMSRVLPGAGGVSATAAVEVAANGYCPVATWNATGFAIAWGDGAGLHLQQVDTNGAPMGNPALVLSRPNAQACPTALVATSSGLAIAWYEGQTVLQENVGLVGAGGTIGTAVQLASEGPGVSVNIALAQLGGEMYAAFVEFADGGSAVTAVTRIDWSQGVALLQGMVPGFLGSLVVADGQLWFTTGQSGVLAYGGVPGAAFPLPVASCTGSGGRSWVADGCGRIVEVGTTGSTPAGVATGFFVQPVQINSPAVALGGVTGTAIVGAQSTFGVLWYARIGPGIPFPGEEPQTGALSFTTLSWR